jgi:hypothetical protein
LPYHTVWQFFIVIVELLLLLPLLFATTDVVFVGLV